MPMFTRGRYQVRESETKADIRKAQLLRYFAFISNRGGTAEADGLDADEFDSICRHFLIEDRKTGQLVCCFRILPLRNGSEISRCYSAKYYELSGLTSFPGPMVEMGRFCIHPEHSNPDVLRIAWGAMTEYVDNNNVELLFGCSSFEGVDAESYADAFALLKERHLAPKPWLPRVKAPKVFRFARNLRLRKPNLKAAMGNMPPLLRTYLMMGGWVSDHAVIDNDLNTLHVFTGVEIKRVPETRAKLLRMT